MTSNLQIISRQCDIICEICGDDIDIYFRYNNDNRQYLCKYCIYDEERVPVIRDDISCLSTKSSISEVQSVIKHTCEYCGEANDLCIHDDIRLCEICCPHENNLLDY